jgi:hypothetical protein
MFDAHKNQTFLTGAKRREWMGMGFAGMIINSYHGSFPHSLLSAVLVSAKA